MAKPKQKKTKVVVSAPPWSDCVERFRAYQVSEERSPHTIRAYASDLDMFRGWFEKTYDDPLMMEEVSAALIGNWKMAMLDAGTAAATINRRLATLGSFLRWAVDERLVDRPVKNVKAIKLEALGHRGLEPKDERRLLRDVEADARHQAVIHILLYSGMRVGELANLKWRDIKLADRKGSIVISFGKGGKSRKIPVHPRVRAALDALGLAEYRGTDRLVVWGRRGGLRVRAIQAITERYGVAAHQLRHTFARKFLQNNPGEIEQLATILGHSSLDTTRRYITPSEDDLQIAMNRMDPA